MIFQVVFLFGIFKYGSAYFLLSKALKIDIYRWKAFLVIVNPIVASFRKPLAHLIRLDLRWKEGKKSIVMLFL